MFLDLEDRLETLQSRLTRIEEEKRLKLNERARLKSERARLSTLVTDRKTFSPSYDYGDNYNVGRLVKIDKDLGLLYHLVDSTAAPLVVAESERVKRMDKKSREEFIRKAKQNVRRKHLRGDPVLVAKTGTPKKVKRLFGEALNQVKSAVEADHDILSRLKSDEALKVNRYRLEMSEISEQLDQFDPEYLNTLESRKRVLDADIGVITGQLTFQETATLEALGTQKMIRPKGKAGYSLWVGREPVLQVLGGGNQVAYLVSTALNKPLKIESTTIRKAIPEASLDDSVRVLGLEGGDFCVGNGRILGEKPTYYAQKVFDLVDEGVEIFPATIATTEGGIEAYVDRVIQERNPEPRTWHQIHLASMNPAEKQAGELLGSGNQYWAFTYSPEAGSEGVVFVEFDEGDHATYMIEAQHWEELRHKTRQEIRQSKGYIDTEIHNGTKEDWASKISQRFQELGIVA